MKHEFLPSVQCPCCKKYYVIRCSHEESSTEAGGASIQFSSYEKIELKAVDDERT